MPAPKQLLWDIFEEHLDEAAFLWGQWERALDAANYTLAEVASGPEARLLAHLDALVLGGPEVAEELLLPALAGEEPGLVAAAAWALVQAEPAAHEGGVDHQDAVIAALVGGGPPASAAIARALRLSPRADLGRIARLWREGAPAARAVAFDLIAPNEPAWAREQFEPVLGGADAPARASALRALRRAPDRALAVKV